MRNSIVAVVLGCTAMILAHESSHAVSAVLQGHVPVQFPDMVNVRGSLSDAERATMAMTGPLFSLVSGIVLAIIDRFAKPFAAAPFWRLVWLWFVFSSIAEGTNYFAVAGVLGSGDTATAFRLCHAPGWVFIASSVVGIAALFAVACFFSAVMTDMCATLADKRVLAVWSWLYSTISVVVLTLGYALLTRADLGNTLTSIVAGAIAIGIFGPLSMIFRRGRYGARQSPEFRAHPVAGYVALAVLIAVNIFLTFGVLW